MSGLQMAASALNELQVLIRLGTGLIATAGRVLGMPGEADPALAQPRVSAAASMACPPHFKGLGDGRTRPYKVKGRE